jgi:hypothetical protein
MVTFAVTCWLWTATLTASTPLAAFAVMVMVTVPSVLIEQPPVYRKIHRRPSR